MIQLDYSPFQKILFMSERIWLSAVNKARNLGNVSLGESFPHIFSRLLLVVSAGYFVLLVDILQLSLRSYSLFLSRYARLHRVLGALYLLWLVVGYVDLHSVLLPRLYYDVTPNVLGIVLTISAAHGFRYHHQWVKNVASGSLDEHATVTYDEMIEHSFYQGLNLVQILYLHMLPWLTETTTRVLGERASSPRGSSASGKEGIVLVWVFVTMAPWMFRGYFPVHSFSKNYSQHALAYRKERQQMKGFVPSSLMDGLIPLMYRLKRYQYVFYKNFLLYGLNLSVLMNHSIGLYLTERLYFKWY